MSIVRVRFAGANANIDLRVAAAAAAGPVAGSRELGQAPPLALERRRSLLSHTHAPVVMFMIMMISEVNL